MNQNQPIPAKERMRRIVFSKPFISVIALLGAYTLVGFFLAPYLIERTLTHYVAKDLNSQLTIGKVRTNPYTFTLDVRKLSLKNKNGSSLFGLDRLFADFEMKSLLHRAWTFREIDLHGPFFNVDIAPDGTLNLARLAADASSRQNSPAASAQDRPKTGGSLPKLNVERILIDNGQLTLSDRRGSKPAQASLESFELEGSALTTTSDQPGTVSMRFSLPEGGKVSCKGDFALTPIASKGQFTLEEFQPAIVWRFFRDEVFLMEPAGHLRLTGSYRLNLGQNSAELVLEQLSALLSGLTVTLRDNDKPILKLARVELDNGRFDLAAGELNIGRLVLAKGNALFDIDRTGALNWQGITADSGKSKPKIESDRSRNSRPFHLKLGRLTIADVGLQAVDRSQSEPVHMDLNRLGLNLSADVSWTGQQLQTRASNIAMDLSDLALVRPSDEPQPLLSASTIALRDGRVDLAKREFEAQKLEWSGGGLALAVAEDGKLDWQLIFSKESPAGPHEGKAAEPALPTPFRVKLNGLAVKNLAVGYVDRSRIEPIRATIQQLDVQLSLNVEQKANAFQTVIDDVALDMAGLALEAVNTNETLLQVPDTKIRGGRLDLTGRAININEIAVSGGHADVRRDTDGHINYIRLFGSRAAGAIKKEVAQIQEEAEAEQFPWTLQLADFHLDRFGLNFSDRSIKSGEIFNLQELSLKVSDFKTKPDSPFDFDLVFTVAQGGKTTLQGKADIYRPSLEANLDADRLTLAPLQHYLDSVVRLTLESGNFSLKGTLTYGKPDSGQITFTGDSRIDDFRSILPENAQPFLAFATLQAEGINLNTAHKGIAVDRVELSEPSGKLVIRADRTLNVQDVIVAGKPLPAESMPPSASASAEEPFAVQIKEVRVDQGELDFADLSLTSQFAAKIHDLKGTVNGFSSAPASRAFIDLEGRVEQYGHSNIRGEIQPLSAAKYAHVTMQFQNIDMSALSPYSGRFAGRKIASGKLNADLRYKIKDGKLKGDNQFILEHFRLGERVESPSAQDIPLDLAIALLKDSSGQINVQLPISGNLNDPNFSLGGIIGKAVSGLLTKIVTAPFQALGALIGTKGENFDTVAFEPGQSKLPPAEEEKLAHLADALQKRPQLALDVKGAYNQRVDGKALQERALRQEMTTRSGEKGEPGREPAPIDFKSPSTQKIIELLAEEKLPAAGLQALREKYNIPQPEGADTNSKTTESKQSKPDLKGFYQAVFGQLAQTQTVQEADLINLAKARAEAVVRQLTTAGGFDRSRLDVLDSQKTDKTQSGMVPLKLTLTTKK